MIGQLRWIDKVIVYQLIVYQAKLPSIYHFQLLKCEDSSKFYETVNSN